MKTIAAPHANSSRAPHSSCTAFTAIFATLLSLGTASTCQAIILPFTGTTIDTSPLGDIITEPAVLTSYTTSQGTVNDLSNAVFARGIFDVPGGTSTEVRNFWGSESSEVDGVVAALDLDLSRGVLNAGDSDSPPSVDVGETGQNLAQFFFSQGISSGAVGGANDFFIVEFGTGEEVSIVPLDSSGNVIGTGFSTFLSDFGSTGFAANIIADGVGSTITSDVTGFAFDLEDLGTLSGTLAGVGIGGELGIDAAVVGVNSTLAPLVVPPNPTLVIDRLTGEVVLHNDGGGDLNFNEYSISSPLGALEPNEWTPITGNKDAAFNGGDGTIDNDDAWTVTSSLTDATELAESESVGDGGTLVANGTPLSLGEAWFPWFNETDLVMEVTLADGFDTTLTIPITYEGNGDQPISRSDFNHDGTIDEDDWVILRDNSYADLSGLSAIQAYAKGDVNFDGANDILDFNLFLLDYESLNGAGTFASLGNVTPEPSSYVILGTALMIGCFFSRRPRATQNVTTAVACLCIGLVASESQAVAPYTADANTVHLYHFDVSGGSTMASNLGTAGNNVIAFDGNPATVPATTDSNILGAQGFVGFGASADIYAGDKSLGFDGNNDLQFERNIPDHIPVSSFTGASGEFSLELMVNMHDGLGFPVHRELIGMDQSTPQLPRGITFRLTDSDTLRFSSISDFTDPQFVETPIPTTGPHAFAENEWFHVAYTYDGNGTGNFYWTRADSDATSANLVGTASHDDITGTLTGPLAFGNEARGTSSFGLNGLLDEVRISSVARTADEFIFDNGDPTAFTLQVNPDSGQVSLVNTTDAAISFSSYELTGDVQNTFVAGNWSSLSDQSGSNPFVNPVDGPDQGSVEGNGIGETWDEAGSSDVVLAEQFFYGDTTLEAGQSIPLGQIYNTSTLGDVTFRYRDSTLGAVLEGLVDLVTSAGLDGDFNDDGIVNLADYTVWRDNLGANESTGVLSGNGNGGTVDATDYGLWKSNFGSQSGGLQAAATNVPEPTNFISMILVVCLAGLTGYRASARSSKT